jgi:hypothetical protein
MTMRPTCVACRCRLGDERTIVRRKDGTVRFEMCNACFDQRFCETCVMYFPSTQGRQEHRCPN